MGEWKNNSIIIDLGFHGQAASSPGKEPPSAHVGWEAWLDLEPVWMRSYLSRDLKLALHLVALHYSC
jgi:hypothetical protein